MKLDNLNMLDLVNRLSKYTEESALTKIKGACQVRVVRDDNLKIVSQTILPSRSLGLRLLSAVDYLVNYCGYDFAPLQTKC